MYHHIIIKRTNNSLTDTYININSTKNKQHKNNAFHYNKYISNTHYKNIPWNRAIYINIRNIPILNPVAKKLVSLKKIDTPYHIGNIAKIIFRTKYFDSIFDHYKNIVDFTTAGDHILISPYPNIFKILHPQISFLVKP